MSDENKTYDPAGESVLTTYICPRDAAKAMPGYSNVFGAVEEGQRYVDPSGQVGYAQIVIAGTRIMLSDAFADFGAGAPEQGNTTAAYALNLYAPDADRTVVDAEFSGSEPAPVQ